MASDPYDVQKFDPWGAGILALGLLFFLAGFFWGFYERAVVGLLFLLLLLVAHETWDG